jgi:5-hydroxyisourate hydrolase
MSQLTTHILDTTKGKPAEGISIFLFQQHNDSWKQLTIGTTQPAAKRYFAGTGDL